MFSAAGVAEWQQDLAAASPAERQAEAALAAAGLDTFLPTRFTLTAEQVAYLDGLDAALCILWAAQIAYAITAGIPIELEKATQPSAVEELNTKFIESEERTGTGRSSEPDGKEGEYYLRFTIGY